MRPDGDAADQLEIPDGSVNVYCERCGVEIEAGVAECPLCGGTGQTEEEPTLTEYSMDEPPELVSVLRRSVRHSVLGIGLTVVIILLIIDVGTGSGVSWAPLAITPVIALTVVVALPFLTRSWWVAFLGSIVTIAGMLASLDLLANGKFDWFAPVAVPIVGVIALVVIAVQKLLPRVPGVNKAGVILAGVAVVTTAVDGTVAFYRGGGFSLGWSLIVLISVLPVAALMALLHVTILRYIDLRRRFHL
jgi:hypothetical protein